MFCLAPTPSAGADLADFSSRIWRLGGFHLRKETRENHRKMWVQWDLWLIFILAFRLCNSNISEMGFVADIEVESFDLEKLYMLYGL